MPAKKQLFILIGIYILLFISSAIITSLIVHLIKNNTTALPTHTPLAISQTPKPTPVRTDRSVLLIGHGGAGHDGGGLADTLLLIRADSVNKKLSFISIPRDSWVNGTKINESFAKGGGDLAKKTVEQISGLTVDYFISIDFGSFLKAIDTLGGIDVNVPFPLDDKFYPVKGLENESCGFTPEQIEEFKTKFTGFELEKQFACRYEEVKFDTGTAHMDGATALKFVRSRHSSINGGDFARSQRQVAVLNAIESKAITLGALDKLPEFFKQFSAMIQTDIDPQILNPTLQFLGNLQNYTKQNINLNTDNVFKESKTAQGSYILIPKNGDGAWGGVQEFISQEINK